MKSLEKINAESQFLYRQNEFVNPKLLKLFGNPLTQPHFDYAHFSWHPLVNKKIKKIQVTQIKFGS